MSMSKTSGFRAVLLAVGVAVLAAAVALLYGQAPRRGIPACLRRPECGLAVGNADPLRCPATVPVIHRVPGGRAQISTLGKLCDITAYFCLAAAFISWVAQR